MLTNASHALTALEGERADFPGLGSRYVLRGYKTDGRFAVIEHTIPPRTLAAPTHVHENEDEYSFVLTGTMGAEIGDETVTAEPGDLVAKPRGVPHAFWNPGDTETRVLEIISPAGFEQFFADLAPLLAVDGEPDFEAVLEIQVRYGLTMDFDTIGSLMQAHGLES